MTFLKSPAARRFAATVAATATVLAVMTVVAVPDRASQKSNDFVCSTKAAFSTVLVETGCYDSTLSQYRL